MGAEGVTGDETGRGTMGEVAALEPALNVGEMGLYPPLIELADSTAGGSERLAEVFLLREIFVDGIWTSPSGGVADSSMEIETAGAIVPDVTIGSDWVVPLGCGVERALEPAL